MGKAESSYVTPPSPSSNQTGDGSSTRSYPGGFPDSGGAAGQGVSPDELTAGPAPILPTEQQKTVISKPGANGDSSFGPTASPFELGRALEGQRLGDFELEEFVGGGGMGAVFRARDTQLGRIVAVKVLSRDQAADDETLRRFKNEAQSAARLDHENIARVHYVGEDRGWNYIVFEFIEGINLRDLVQQSGPLPLGQAVSFTLQVAEALSHASRREVVHRDIKPSNVLIMSEGKAKLVDMGLARLHHMDSDQADLTASGVTLGTFDYISPEQARDPRAADVRSDLYSLGCTFYFMLTGRPPFPEGTVLQKLLSHSSEEPPDPRQFRPDLPEEVTHVLTKMLNKHPDDRYQEASELIGELLLMAERLGLPVAERGSAVWITPGHARISPWERHLPWAIPVAVLVVIAVLLNFSSTTPQWDDDPPRRQRRKSHKVSSVVEAGGEMLPGDSGQPPAAGGSMAPVPRSRAADTDGADSDAVAGTAADAPGPRAEGAGPAGSNGGSTPGTTAGDRPREPDGGTRNPAAEMVADPSVSEGEAVASVESTDLADSVDPGTDGQANDPLPLRPIPVIVGEGGEPSLEAALIKTARETADVTIELRFNGPMFVDAIRLEDRRITIRAGIQYEPVIVLRPRFDDLVGQRPSMITMVGGELILERVHLEFRVRDEPVDQWSLFALQDVELLSLAHSTMTIRNDAGRRAARHPTVAFFDLGTAAGSDSARSNGETYSNSSAIDLFECVARGEADLVRTTADVPMRLSWLNGLLITTGRLLHVLGADHRPAEDIYVEIDLDHVTAIVDDGLVLQEAGEENQHQRMVAVNCRHCILMTHPSSPLVHQRGPGELETVAEPFSFSGRLNFYPETQQLFRLVESTTDLEARRLDSFSVWSKTWAGELLPHREVLWVELPSSRRPVHELTEADYAIIEKSSNSAYRPIGDGGNAGYGANLPQLPPAMPLVPQPPDVLYPPDVPR